MHFINIFLRLFWFFYHFISRYLNNYHKMFVFKPQVHYNRVRRAPAVCPRFLSHMKARPEDFHPPCYLNNNHQQQLPSEGRMQSFNLPPASQTDFLLGKLIKPSGAFTPAASHFFCSPLSSQHGGLQARHWILIPVPTAPPSWWTSLSLSLFLSFC